MTEEEITLTPLHPEPLIPTRPDTARGCSREHTLHRHIPHNKAAHRQVTMRLH